MKNNYYITQSIYSDPGKYLPLLSNLPADVHALRNTIQRFFIHYADLPLFSMQVNNHRYHEMNLRYLSNIIEHILLKDPSDLSIARAPSNRLMGICRDSALFLCAVLRSRGIPARLRSGYVTYFIPGLNLDGLLVEVYDETQNRWRYIDTRTSQMQIDYYGLSTDFSLVDVPPHRFISAAEAWKRCRAGNADPMRFGSRQHRGFAVMRNRLIQDLALLNKHETLVWDLWGLMLNPIGEEVELMDDIANQLILHANDVDYMIQLYQANPALKVSDSVLVDSPFTPQYTCCLRTVYGNDRSF